MSYTHVVQAKFSGGTVPQSFSRSFHAPLDQFRANAVTSGHPLTHTGGVNYGVIDGIRCAIFDGTGQITSPDTFLPAWKDVTTAGPLSVSVWVKATGNTPGVVFGWGTRSTGNMIALYGDSTGMQATNYGATTQKTAPSSTWTHYLISRGERYFQIYRNGVLAFTDEYFELSYILSNRLFIGANGANGEYFTGCVAMARVYNRELTVAEITELYNEPRRILAPATGIDAFGRAIRYNSLSEAGVLERYDIPRASALIAFLPLSEDAVDRIHGDTWQSGDLTFTSALSSRGALFNGQGSYVKQPQPYNFSTTSEVTFSCWFNLTELPPDNLDGTTCWSLIDWATSSYRASMRVRNSPPTPAWGWPGGMNIQAWGNNNWDSTIAAGVAAEKYDINTWNHVCATFSATHLNVYLNGVQLSNNTMLSAIPGSCNIVLGRTVVNGGDLYNTGFFKGFISRATLYNKALTAEEVYQLMKATAGSRYYVDGVEI